MTPTCCADCTQGDEFAYLLFYLYFVQPPIITYYFVYIVIYLFLFTVIVIIIFFFISIFI